MTTYDYLKRWLSREQIRRIREGNNPEKIKLSRQQVLNIMKDKSKNYTFLNILLNQARENEALSINNKQFHNEHNA